MKPIKIARRGSYDIIPTPKQVPGYNDDDDSVQ